MNDRKLRGEDAKKNGFCVSCFERPIIFERSQSYCEHCLELRKRANQKYNKSHRRENYERTKRWNQKNKDKVKSYSKQYRQQHKEKVAMRNKQYKQTEKYKAWQRLYCKKNKIKLNFASKKWCVENRKRYNDYQKDWRKNNKDKSKLYSKTWRKKNPEKVREISRVRRARKAFAEGIFTEEEWKELLNNYDNQCLSCGSKENLEPDHVIPLSRGGDNYIDNIQPLCKSCNCKKHASIVDFRIEYERNLSPF